MKLDKIINIAVLIMKQLSLHILLEMKKIEHLGCIYLHLLSYM